MDPENFSRSTFGNHYEGDELIMSTLKLIYYLVTPKGLLKRDDGYSQDIIAEWDEKSQEFIPNKNFAGLGYDPKYPTAMMDYTDNDLLAVKNDEPIPLGKAIYPWDWNKLPDKFNKVPPGQKDFNSLFNWRPIYPGSVGPADKKIKK